LGGAAAAGTADNTAEATHDATTKFANMSTLTNSSGENIVMSRTAEVILMSDVGRELSRFKVPYGAMLKVADASAVKKGQVIAQWDAYTIPIIVEATGDAHFIDLKEGVSVNEKTDDTTGMSSREVIDWKSNPRGSDLKPSIVLQDAKANVVTLPNGGQAVYSLPVGAVLSIEEGQKVAPGDILARIPKESMKSRDITGGLPRVAELFEARKPKDSATISEVSGTVSFGKDLKGKRRILVTGKTDDGTEDVREYLIPKGIHLNVMDGDYVEAGHMIVEGSQVPQDILRAQGVEVFADYMIREIQGVYRLQGVTINDKHIEVIVRQMLRKVMITKPGESTFVNGELAELSDVEKENAKLVAAGKIAAQYELHLQGITKASLTTQSFVSAASFQETTKVLTEAAVGGKMDTLQGLKENVIVGRLIPAGTGKFLSDMRKAELAQDVSAQVTDVA
jgi:DNA-directed RNA polymerase subunit beta'